VDGLILTPTDHLSPPSTMSRLSDSDTTSDCDIDGMTPGASISSMGSSASPPPLLEVTVTTNNFNQKTNSNNYNNFNNNNINNSLSYNIRATLHWTNQSQNRNWIYYFVHTYVYSTHGENGRDFTSEAKTTDSNKSEDTRDTHTRIH